MVFVNCFKVRFIFSKLKKIEIMDVKVFVDTAPLMEKPIAQLAGIGWQGKHTNLVSQEFGSWLFLGVLLVNKILYFDNYQTDLYHCQILYIQI